MSRSVSAEKLDPNLAVPDADAKLLFYDIRQLGLEGRGWEETQSPFDRLPAKAEKIVPPAVWDLSHHSAGIFVRFVTDSTSISARWKLRFPSLQMHHMPSTGMSSLDLYVRGTDQWRWAGIGIAKEYPAASAAILSGIKPGRRQFMLYLPLYNGVESVEIGIDKGAYLRKAPPQPDARPIVFYGTSIVQGGCASRPGMAHPAILGRWLARPAINLGFSGNGKMEVELAELLGEIDASAYVLDCLPNMNAELLKERFKPFMMKLRSLKPRTPIVLVENVTYQNAHLCADKMKRVVQSNKMLRREFKSLPASVAKKIRLVAGDTLYGNDWEATMDGAHASDLGFLRIAEALAPVLRPLLRAR